MPKPAQRLNFTQLATLCEFARQGTLAAAAQSLRYSAGAVSQHLSALERELGVTLVAKSGRRLVLTDTGRLMVGYAERLLETEREALRVVALSEGSVSGSLVIGTWGSTAAGLLAPIIERMRVRFPGVSLQSREVDVDAGAAAVRRGDVDVAFGLDYEDAPLPRDDALATVRLHKETFMVALAPDFEDGNGSPVADTLDIVSLQELDWILPPPTGQYGIAMRTGFRRRGIEPRVVHEVTDTAASLQLAAAGLGATLMTDLMVRLNPKLELRQWLMQMPLTREIVLITPADVQHRPTIPALCEIVMEVVGQVLGRSPELANQDRKHSQGPVLRTSTARALDEVESAVDNLRFTQ